MDVLAHVDRCRYYFQGGGGEGEVVRAVTSVGIFFCEGVQFLFYYFAEFKAYESAAQSLYSKFLLGYVTGETATSL